MRPLHLGLIYIIFLGWTSMTSGQTNTEAVATPPTREECEKDWKVVEKLEACRKFIDGKSRERGRRSFQKGGREKDASKDSSRFCSCVGEIQLKQIQNVDCVLFSEPWDLSVKLPTACSVCTFLLYQVTKAKNFCSASEAEASAAPEIPTVPETTAAPEIPTVPETTAAPEIPTVPETTAAPEIPTVSETTTAAPKTTTAAPETTAALETPTAPETPTVPGTPAAPAPSESPTFLPIANNPSEMKPDLVFPLMPTDEYNMNNSSDSSLNIVTLDAWTLVYRMRAVMNCSCPIQTESEKREFMGKLSMRLAEKLEVPLSRVPVIDVEEAEKRSAVLAYFEILPGAYNNPSVVSLFSTMRLWVSHDPTSLQYVLPGFDAKERLVWDECSISARTGQIACPEAKIKLPGTLKRVESERVDAITLSLDSATSSPDSGLLLTVLIGLGILLFVSLATCIFLKRTKYCNKKNESASRRKDVSPEGKHPSESSQSTTSSTFYNSDQDLGDGRGVKSIGLNLQSLKTQEDEAGDSGNDLPLEAMTPSKPIKPSFLTRKSRSSLQTGKDIDSGRSLDRNSSFRLDLGERSSKDLERGENFNSTSNQDAQTTKAGSQSRLVNYRTVVSRKSEKSLIDLQSEV